MMVQGSKYLEVLNFIEKYGGNQYKKKEKCNSVEEQLYMEAGSIAGKNARSLFDEIVEAISRKYELTKGKITQWQNSGTFVSYIWCQLKKPQFQESNISISVFAEKVNKIVRFRASVELAVDNATEDEKETYRQLLDKELDSELVYVSGGNNEKELVTLENRNPEIVKKQHQKRVQVSYILNEGNLQSDESFMESLYDGIERLLMYYDFIFNNPNSEWWPSLTEYNPGISKEQWLEMLGDGKTFTDNAYFAIAAMYDFGGTATCRQLENNYGKTADFYRTALGVQVATKVKNKFGLPYCSDTDENSKVWPILFQGRKATSDEPGSYVWKMRKELYDALTDFNIKKYLASEEEETNLTTKEIITTVCNYIKKKGFTYPEGLIENFYLSLKSKPFVILAGTSGTGKTRLVKLFAEAVGATTDNGRYKLVAVRPDWSDSSDLFGHTNLSGKFVPGKIIQFIKEAIENYDKPYFLCLDEMNLARVEYYLSDFLSVIETRHRTKRGIETSEIDIDDAGEKLYGSIFIPENLYVIGTVNMDETTFPFSKKVLDRANTIEFSYVDLEPDFEDAEEAVTLTVKNEFLKAEYLNLKMDIPPEQRELAIKISSELQEINKILQIANAHIGYRVRDEIIYYMVNNELADLLDYEEAMDNQIMQKILPRIQGSSNSVKELLCALFKKCAGDYTSLNQMTISEQMKTYVDTNKCIYRKSAEKISYMMRRYNEDGFTSYWL